VLRLPPGNGEHPENVPDSLQGHAEEGLGSILLSTFPSEAVVVFDVGDEERGLVDHGELGNALGKIDPVAALQFFPVTDGGVDNKGVPPAPLEDQHGADVSVDHLHRPLQGDVEQIFRFEGDMAEIRQFLEGRDLGNLLVEGDELLAELRLQGLKGGNDALDFVGGGRGRRAGSRSGRRCRRDGAGDPFGQGGDIVEDVAHNGKGEKGEDQDGHDEEGNVFVVQELVAEGEEEESGQRYEKEEGENDGELVIKALALHGKIVEYLFYVHDPIRPAAMNLLTSGIL